ncbi:plasmid recombination protein [Variovorax sp. ZT5P49]|uniref:plasmid recombination protein n=1 Tax=Variovorax sp. ZT5P49 TaxID=3443733 RepID=UPI003F473208
MYCIAQFEKIKGAGNMSNIAKHNLRTHLSEADKERVDSSLSHLNKILFNPLGIDEKSAPSVWAKLEEHWEKNKIERKSDSVHAVDLILSTSPEFWGDWRVKGVITHEGQKKIDDWCKVQLDFIQKHFGPEALKFAVLHLDESNPHIHLILSPEQTKILRYKNQYGSQEKRVTSLNAKRWNPVFWRKFLTSYAAANNMFGLKRGTEFSMLEKITIKDYAKLTKIAASFDYETALGKIIADVVKGLGMVNTKASVKELMEKKLAPRLKILAESNKALKNLLALDRAKEYELLKKLQEKAEIQLKEALASKEYHGNKLKKIVELEAQNKEQAKIIKAKDEVIEAQRLEIERLELKQKLTANDPSYKLKA